MDGPREQIERAAAEATGDGWGRSWPNADDTRCLPRLWDHLHAPSKEGIYRIYPAERCFNPEKEDYSGYQKSPSRVQRGRGWWWTRGNE